MGAIGLSHADGIAVPIAGESAVSRRGVIGESHGGGMAVTGTIQSPRICAACDWAVAHHADSIVQGSQTSRISAECD